MTIVSRRCACVCVFIGARVCYGRDAAAAAAAVVVVGDNERVVVAAAADDDNTNSRPNGNNC